MFQTEEYKVKYNIFLEEALEKRLKQERLNNQKTLRSELEKFSGLISKRYEEVSLLILKGCFISNNSYKKIRFLLSYNLQQETAIVLRSQLPKICNDSLNSVYVER